MKWLALVGLVSTDPLMHHEVSVDDPKMTLLKFSPVVGNEHELPKAPEVT